MKRAECFCGVRIHLVTKPSDEREVWIADVGGSTLCYPGAMGADGEAWHDPLPDSISDGAETDGGEA